MDKNRAIESVRVIFTRIFGSAHADQYTRDEGVLYWYVLSNET